MFKIFILIMHGRRIEVNEKKKAILTLTAILSILLFIAVLQGCSSGSSGTETPAPTQSPSPTATVTPTPSPTPTPSGVTGYVGLYLCNEDTVAHGRLMQARILLQNSEGTIPSGTHTVTTPGNENYILSENTQGDVIAINYYYGNPATHVENADMGLSGMGLPPQSILPYVTGLNIDSGSETGTYSVDISGTIVDVTDNYGYYPNLSISTPSNNSTFNITDPINVSWNSLGSAYVYNVAAYQFVSGDSPPTQNFWTPTDMRDVNFADPSNYQQFLQSLTSDTSVTIPGNLFSTGQNVIVKVWAYNPEEFQYDSTSPYGTCSLNYSACEISLTPQ